MTKFEIYAKLLERFGSIAQTYVAIEEMAELQKELCKWLRGSEFGENIVEEIADVQIMLDQLKLIFGCSDCVEHTINEKLKRTAQRYLNQIQ